jgi:hypothetical protein
LTEAVANLVTEDDEPVDNLFSAKQQRFLVEPLYSSWTPPPDEDHPSEPRPFLADANVGIFYALHQAPLVPDLFLSLDVRVAEDWYAKEHRSYFVWEFGKVPEVALEIVSNRKGGELSAKLRGYARMGMSYYVVYDPTQQLSQKVLRVYELGFGKRYRLRQDQSLPDVGLRLSLWSGVFEGVETTWLRWCDPDGKVIPTGAERASREAKRANREAKRASREAERAARLAAKLRELGVDPDQF